MAVRSRAKLTMPEGMNVGQQMIESAMLSPGRMQQFAGEIMDPDVPGMADAPPVRRAPAQARPSMSALGGLAAPFAIDPNENAAQADERYNRHLRSQDAMEQILKQQAQQGDPDWQRSQAVMDSRKMNEIVGSPEFFDTQMRLQKVGNQRAALAQQGQSNLYFSPYAGAVRASEHGYAQDLAETRYVRPAEIKAQSEVERARVDAEAQVRESIIALEEALANSRGRIGAEQVRGAANITGDIVASTNKPDVRSNALQWYQQQQGIGAGRLPQPGVTAPGPVPAQPGPDILTQADLLQLQRDNPELAGLTVEQLADVGRRLGYAVHP